MLYIETASYTHRGGHEINEDSFCCAGDFFAVADGLGGHINGEEASRCAIDYLKEHAHGGYNEETVAKLLEGANSAVFTQAKGARTTVAVLFAENGVFRYANVGDSRVYIFRNDRVLTMTKDHSVCRAAVDMGTMEFDEIRRSEDRSKLLKVLGNDKELKVPKGYPPIPMEEGDAFLICSDGFWDYVLESEMEADLLKSDTPQKWLDHMLKRHIAAAMNKGDNYTAVCGMVRAKREAPAYTPVPAAENETANRAAKKKFPIGALIAVPIIAVVIGAAVFFANNFFRADEPEEIVTETTTVTEESTETTTVTEESTETTTVTEGSTETTTVTEESTETTTVTEGSTETTTVTEESTETTTVTEEDTETTTVTEEDTETTTVTEEYTGIFGTAAEPDTREYPYEDYDGYYPPYIDPLFTAEEV